MDLDKIKEGLFLYEYKSLYDVRMTCVDDRKYLPRKYEDDFLLRALSRTVLRNDKVHEFLRIIQAVIFKCIRSVDYIRHFKNYTVSKYYELK